MKCLLRYEWVKLLRSHLPEGIDEYMHLLLSGENEETCLKMLNEKRKSTLDKIHFYEKQISNLDYLRHEIKKRYGGKIK